MTSFAKLDPTAPTRYGFYGRLTANFPSQVVADTTEVCNLACIHCTHPEFKKSDNYRARMLAPDLNAKMVDEVAAHGRDKTLYIRYSGNGEPLVHPHLFEMLAYAAKNSGTTVTLTTNGTLLNSARMEKLLATGVNLVDISLDAFTSETYAAIRVNGNLEVTRANVLNLIKAARTATVRPKVVVSFVEQPQNRNEIADFEQYWRDNGADYVVVRRLHTNANSTAKVVAQVASTATAEPRRPCLYPWERILLNPSGHLSFCPMDWVHGSDFTDYRTTTIKDTWQGEFYRQLRAAHLENNYSCHGFCGQCPDWKSTRWPEQGRSYADMVQEFKALE